MTGVPDLTLIAAAADPNVSGVAVLRPDRVAEPGWTVVERADGLRVRIDTSTGVAPLAAAQKAILTADLSPAAVAARAAPAIQAVAAAAQANPGPTSRLLRAAVLTLVDENNLLRARLRALETALSGGSAYANFRAAVAALPPLPDRTPAQVNAALLAKNTTHDAD